MSEDMHIKLSRSGIYMTVGLLFLVGLISFFELFAAMGLATKTFFSLASAQSIIIPFISLQRLLETVLTNLYFRPHEAQTLFDTFRFVTIFLAWVFNIIYVYFLSDLIISVSKKQRFSKKIALIIILLAIMGILSNYYSIIQR